MKDKSIFNDANMSTKKREERLKTEEARLLEAPQMIVISFEKIIQLDRRGLGGFLMIKRLFGASLELIWFLICLISFIFGVSGEKEYAIEEGLMTSEVINYI